MVKCKDCYYEATILFANTNPYKISHYACGKTPSVDIEDYERIDREQERECEDFKPKMTNEEKIKKLENDREKSRKELVKLRKEIPQKYSRVYELRRRMVALNREIEARKNCLKVMAKHKPKA